MRWMVRAFLWVIAVLLVSSCRRREAVDPVLPPGQEEHFFDEARLTDVSLPIGVQAHDLSATQPSGDCALQYTSHFTNEVLRDFYLLDMERLGWECVSDVTVPGQIVLSFEKPSRRCILSITLHKKERSGVTIFVSQKQARAAQVADISALL